MDCRYFGSVRDLSYLDPCVWHTNAVKLLIGIQEKESSLRKSITEIGINILLAGTGLASTFKEAIKATVSFPTALFITHIALNCLRTFACDSNLFIPANDYLPTFDEAVTTAKKAFSQAIGVLISIGTALGEATGPGKFSKYNIAFLIKLGNVDQKNKEIYEFAKEMREDHVDKEEKRLKQEEAEKDLRQQKQQHQQQQNEETKKQEEYTIFQPPKVEEKTDPHIASRFSEDDVENGKPEEVDGGALGWWNSLITVQSQVQNFFNNSNVEEPENFNV